MTDLRPSVLLLLVACSAAPAGEPGPPAVPVTATPQPTPAVPRAPGEPSVIDVATGAYHTCALIKDGTVRCAGHNDHGQLGIGSFDDQKHPVMTPVPGLRDAVSLAAGWTHTCALDRGGAVWCWGDDTVVLTGPKPRQGVGWGHPKVKRIAGVSAASLNRSMSVYRTLVLTPGSKLLSWGAQTDGTERCRAGVGPAKPCARTPMDLQAPAQAVQVAASALTTCVLLSSGQVQCRGFDLLASTFEQTKRFAVVPGLDQVVKLGVGESHACAVRKSGEVLCWGHNDEGQLGLGAAAVGDGVRPPTKVEVGPAVDVAMAYKRSCALLRDGTVWCWGASIQPDGSFAHGRKATPSPIAVPGLTGVRKIALATSHSCAVTKTGRLWCWGSNESGEVADGFREQQPLPIPVVWTKPGAQTLPVPDRSVVAVDLATSDSHACAITRRGELGCWGFNGSGQIGIGRADGDAHPVPLVVPGLSSVAGVDVDSGRTCAVSRQRGKDVVSCWGDNSYGALGDGSTQARSKPTVVAGAKGMAVAVGSVHGCALDGVGLVRCWGSNVAGQLGVPAPICPWQPTGLGTFGAQKDIPCLPKPGPAVTKLPKLRKLVAGSMMSCGIAHDGRATCWGENRLGGLGDGTTTKRDSPTRLALRSAVVDIGIGNQHACALTKSGQIWCWGHNGSGQLGAGRTGGTRPLPAPVRGVSGATALAVGGVSSCAVLSSGEAKCWGGMPGAGEQTGVWREPSTVPGLPAIQKMALGFQHACALAVDGSIWCWGYGPAGLLGSSHDRLARPAPLRWR